MPICYTTGEIIDRLIITKLKIWHLSKSVDNISQQSSLSRLEGRLLEALEETMKREVVVAINTLVAQHIEQWHLEEDMANPDYSDEEKVGFTDRIVELNANRVKLVQVIDNG